MIRVVVEIKDSDLRLSDGEKIAANVCTVSFLLLDHIRSGPVVFSDGTLGHVRVEYVEEVEP